MSEPAWLIIAVVLLALVFDFTNGWNGATNAIATVVSTRVLTPAQAVLLAGVLNAAGAFSSTAVTKTIGRVGGAGLAHGGAAAPNARALKPSFAAAIFSPLLGPVLGFAAMAALSWIFLRANPRVGHPLPPGPAVHLLQDSRRRWVESC